MTRLEMAVSTPAHPEARRRCQTAVAERLVIAMGRYIGKGLDDPRLDALFLAMPVCWNGTLIQYSGRLHRRHPVKTQVTISGYGD